MSVLWIATNNRKKLVELQRMLAPLAIELRSAKELGAEFAPIEDAPDFAGNARIKASLLAKLSGGMALGDDSGLCVDALNGAPGTHSARFGGPGLTDRDRLKLLLERLQGMSGDERKAHFSCHLSLCGPDGKERLAVSGHCHGILLVEPRGDGGFGYDPAFVAEEHRPREPMPSFAELSAAEKDAVSHRGRALEQLLMRLTATPELLRP